MWLLRLVVAAFILYSMDFVSAESAWILWKSENKLKGFFDTEADNWKIEQSYQTMKECQISLKDFISQQEKYYSHPNLTDEAKSEVLTKAEGSKGYIIIRFLKRCKGECANIIRRDLICLPDTIDPRSPKR